MEALYLSPEEGKTCSAGEGLTTNSVVGRRRSAGDCQYIYESFAQQNKIYLRATTGKG